MSTIIFCSLCTLCLSGGISRKTVILHDFCQKIFTVPLLHKNLSFLFSFHFFWNTTAEK